MIYKLLVERIAGGTPEVIPVLCNGDSEARRRAETMLARRASPLRITVTHGERRICEVAAEAPPTDETADTTFL